MLYMVLPASTSSKCLKNKKNNSLWHECAIKCSTISGFPTSLEDYIYSMCAKVNSNIEVCVQIEYFSEISRILLEFVQILHVKF